MSANINNIPTEIFLQILGHIPIEDASSVLKVNREWYQRYRTVLFDQRQEVFDKILHSPLDDWDIPIRLDISPMVYQPILEKLCNFCENFSLDIPNELLKRETALIERKEYLEREKAVINKLLDHYENSLDFDGWFPDELWNRRKENRWNLGFTGDKLTRVWRVLETRIMGWFLNRE